MAVTVFDPFGSFYKGQVNAEALRGQTLTNDEQAMKLKLQNIGLENMIGLRNSQAGVDNAPPSNALNPDATPPVPGAGKVTSPGGTVDPILGTAVNSGGAGSLNPTPLWQFDQQEGTRQLTEAKNFRKYGFFEMAQKAEDTASKYFDRSRLAQDADRKNRMANLEKASAILGNVTDEPTLQLAMKQANSIDPLLAGSLDIPRDPITGRWLYTPDAKAALQFAGKQLLTTMDKMKIEDQQSEIERRLNQTKTDQANTAETVRRDNMVDARSREGLAIHAQELGDRREERATVRGEMALTREQAALDKDPGVQTYSKYQTGVNVARSTLALLADPVQGLDNVSPAQALTVSKAFSNMIQDYRPRSGGKNDSKDIARMNGVFQDLEKYTTTIGDGAKLMARDKMVEAAQVMENLYQDKNAEVVQRSLKAQEAVFARSGDPTALRVQGSIQDALKSGRAKTAALDGKRYIVFGSNKDQMFLIPDGVQ